MQEIEITESVLSDNSEQLVRIIEELRDFGIKISIDGFAKGYSSISCLRYMPVDKVKIDKALKGVSLTFSINHRLRY